MSVITLKGALRESVGKGGARKSRAAGRIPGILYGHGETPVPVSIGMREFQDAVRHHKGGNALVTLSVEGADHTALIRDVQYDPLSHGIIHLDFQRVSLTERIEVEVDIVLQGIAVGVKDGGGVLELILHTVDLRCLPTSIPDSVTVDVSALNIGDSLHVRDLQVEGGEILTDPDRTICTVVPPTVHEEKPAEAAPVEGAAEPELAVERGKKEEGEEKGKEAEKADKGEKKAPEKKAVEKKG